VCDVAFGAEAFDHSNGLGVTCDIALTDYVSFADSKPVSVPDRLPDDQSPPKPLRRSTSDLG
jgi:hypothetical protein